MKLGPSVSELREFPILVATIWKIATDDEGNAALVELTLGELVRVTFTWLRSDHQGSILGDLESTSSQNSGFLILSHEA